MRKRGAFSPFYNQNHGLSWKVEPGMRKTRDLEPPAEMASG